MFSDTNELIERLTEAKTSKKTVDALIKKGTYDQAAKALTTITTTASTITASTTTSSMTEALNSQNKKIKLSAKDNVHIGNLTTTLGEFLIKYYENLLIKSPKDKYFSYLSQNFIIDISNKSQKSQLNYFGVKMATIIKEKYARKPAPCVDQNITKITDSLKKASL